MPVMRALSQRAPLSLPTTPQAAMFSAKHKAASPAAERQEWLDGAAAQLNTQRVRNGVPVPVTTAHALVVSLVFHNLAPVPVSVPVACALWPVACGLCLSLCLLACVCDCACVPACAC